MLECPFNPSSNPYLNPTQIIAIQWMYQIPSKMFTTHPGLMEYKKQSLLVLLCTDLQMQPSRCHVGGKRSHFAMKSQIMLGGYQRCRDVSLQRSRRVRDYYVPHQKTDREERKKNLSLPLKQQDKKKGNSREGVKRVMVLKNKIK